ncbi:hypothetical protein [Reichenbachiella ulvae]|uniref:Anti-bacteriophage protein A/HamA C-terminal domain-containing protein n=1 Tax=Reichenbachiella ulvae TaxID=2980104 RepID=A0ABT3CV35_9BACT|nr:hypothetical protein [Reichenbachiella ulvae]MCV9387384.1 hypothetical protein [Reichenbachiella ulvae]
MPLLSHLNLKCKTDALSRYLKSPEARAISGHYPPHSQPDSKMAKYSRTEDLSNKLNQFLHGLTGTSEDYYSRITPDELIQLKAALANINNILTLKTTSAFANWLSNSIRLTSAEHKLLIDQVEETKPNTNGYDIELPEKRIIAEIKSIVPINNGNQYKAAQWNSILDDARKLVNGKKRISNTKSYFKFIGILDLGERTDQAITKLMTPSRNMRTKTDFRIERHDMVKKLEIIPEQFVLADLSTEKIYIKMVRI